MDVVSAGKICLTEKYATFSGRASRSEYWWFTFIVFAVTSFAERHTPGASFFVAAAMLCPHLAVAFRRLQDTGRSGSLAVVLALLLLTDSFLPKGPYDAVILYRFVLPDMRALNAFAMIEILQFLVYLLFLWWLTGPSQPTTNAYGQPPEIADQNKIKKVGGRT